MSVEEIVPEGFIRRIAGQLDDEADAFFHALQDVAVVSLRYNPLKHSVPGNQQRVPWCSTGVYLDRRPVFTFDPAIHAGCYYVQEASSMFLEQAIVQMKLHERKILALDLCASPGGKTTHLTSLLHPDSFIISNETIHTRIPALRENIMKWGSGNVMVTQNDPSAFSRLESCFDLIVIDAPCSGEGLFRKDKDSVQQWSEQNCDLCVSRQQRILNEIVPCLKPGGILIYSTCTYNPKENEEQVQWLSKEGGLISQQLDTGAFEGIVEIKNNNGFGYAFYPHRVKGEGFFLAVLRKDGSDNSKISLRERRGLFQRLPSALNYLSDWLKPASGYIPYKSGDFIVAMQPGWKEEIEFFYEALHVRYHGIRMAEMKGEKAIPHHALAMSTALNRTAFPLHELNDAQAMSYLRKESLNSTSEKKGWMLASWNEKILGWLNHLGNRANNYYPVEWRVRKN